jgi:4-hydroxy-3-polyprenylbenzoate decarboxylase
VLTGAPYKEQKSFALSDYTSLAREVFTNMNPASDIYFSQGPMDVLDHSCSKLGFGGKMCIDGTWKFDEEKTDEASPGRLANFNKEILLGKFAEIKIVNDDLLKLDIPCLLISVRKNRVGHIGELHRLICSMPEAEGIKMILYVEHTVDANDLPVALWRFCNNADPKRDHTLVQRPSVNEPGKTFACMGFDGTIKTRELDNFHRDWPNIIVADAPTIEAVDAKWKHLGIGDFIPSPSLKFLDQVYGKEAVANP